MIWSVLYTMRRHLVVSAGLCFAMGCLAQTAVHGGGAAWTASDIFQKGGAIGEPPQQYLWSPDGKLATYESHDMQHGQPHDVIAIDAATGQASVLVPQTRLAEVYAGRNDERDQDHRSRYGQSNYHWAPDGRSLLFDSTGVLWLYNLQQRKAVKFAETGEGSGDDPKFSPDGKSISFVRAHNLHVVDIATHRDTALTATADPKLLNGEVDWVYDEELDTRSNYFWAPDGKHVAYLQMNETTVPVYPITDWIPVHSQVDWQTYPQAGDPNPAVRVGIVPAGGGDTVWMKVPASPHNDYIPRFGWVDATHVWVELLHRDHRHIEIYFCNIADGTAKQIFAETANKFFDESYDVDFLPGGQFLWSSWRSGYTHLYLYQYDKQSPMSGDATLVRQLTSGNWDVLGVNGIDTKQGIVYYTSNETDPREAMLWQVHLDGSGKKMLSKMPGVHHASFARDSQHYIDTASALTTPPSAKICNLAGSCNVFWNSKPLTGHHLTYPEMITGKAADGTTLYGELLLPPDMHNAATVPLIVNPYGGPHAQTVQDAFGGANFFFDELLMQHGFAVLHVDNRGMGNRSRAFAEAAWHDFGPVQLKDQLTMVDQVLRDNPQLDGKRLGWWGWSWGGTFTLYALTHSDRFAAGVCVAPVTNWHLYDSIYTERYLGMPQDNPALYHQFSVTTNAAHLHGDLLMVHGTGDDNVHMQNTVQMIQQFVKSGTQYRLMLFPRKTHSIAGHDSRTLLFNAIEEHFAKVLQPQPAK
jgi:dipeptidyl-peptidase-4